MAILRFLVNLPNDIEKCHCDVLTNQKCVNLLECPTHKHAFAAALITVDSNGERFETPRIQDAMEILRWLVNLPTEVLSGVWG
jgi:hypothetical protein